MPRLRNILYLSFIAVSAWIACVITCLFHEHYLRTGFSKSNYGPEFNFPPLLCIAILFSVAFVTRRSWIIGGFWNKFTCVTVGFAVLFVVPLLLGQF